MVKITSLTPTTIGPTVIDDDGTQLIKAQQQTYTDTAKTVNKLIKAAKSLEETVDGLTLDDLANVTVDSPSDGDVLVYSSADSAWKNSTPASFPVGWINLFYGNLTDIPSGWHICDGTNGTPDLRNNFVIGAGSSYSLGATGGSVAHTHTTGDHALTVNEMPSHSHSWTKYNNPNSGSAPHTMGAEYSNPVSVSVSDTGGNAAHNHGATGSTSNIPPYVALYYIMKVS